MVRAAVQVCSPRHLNESFFEQKNFNFGITPRILSKILVARLDADEVHGAPIAGVIPCSEVN